LTNKLQNALKANETLVIVKNKNIFKDLLLSEKTQENNDLKNNIDILFNN